MDPRAKRLLIVSAWKAGEKYKTDIRCLVYRPHPSPLLKALVDKGDLGFNSGRGFQKWSQQDIDTSRAKLREYLLEALKKLD